MAVAEDPSPPSDDIITIKKYANRRLYNTATSSYVTLDHLCEMVKQGKEFQVFDAKSGEDITRSVLTQIIFEEESKGQNLLPIQFLRQLITFYGDSVQNFVPSYLEMSLAQFARNQEQFRDAVASAMSGKTALSQFETQIRNNMEMFERATRMFSPFASASRESSEPTGDDDSRAEIRDLKQQLAEMQAKLDALTKTD